MTSDLEASSVVSVDVTEGTVTFSEAMTVCREALLSSSSGARDDVDCVSNSVVSKRPAIRVETVASPLRKEVTVGVVPFGVSETAGAEDWESRAEVMVPTLVTAVFLERWSPSGAVETSEITRVSTEVLLKSEGELVTRPKLVLNVPVVPSMPGAPGEVAGTGGERPLACDVGETREGDVMAWEGTREDGDVRSRSEEGLVRDPSSEPVPMLMVTSGCAEP